MSATLRNETRPGNARQIAKTYHRKLLLLEAQNCIPVSEKRAIVLNDGQAAIRAQLKAESVTVLLAVIEHARGLQIFDQRSLSQLVLVKVSVPQEQIVDTAHQPASPDGVITG
jgi:hypothetical protein